MVNFLFSKYWMLHIWANLFVLEQKKNANYLLKHFKNNVKLFYDNKFNKQKQKTHIFSFLSYL